MGSFAPGYELDALVIDDGPLGGGADVPIPDRLAKTVYLSDDRHIRAKFIQGREI